MSVDKTLLLTRIQDILSSLELTKNPSELNDHTGLLGSGLGLDSIEILQLVAAIEEEFELTIEDDDLLPEYFLTVGNLIAFINERYLK